MSLNHFNSINHNLLAMKKIVLTLISALSFCSLFSQKIVGNWQGKININGNGLPVIFHFNHDSTGKINGSWDSPKQGAMNLPFTTISATDDSLIVSIKAIDGSYNGRFVGSDSLEGMWHQMGSQLPLNFKKFTGSTDFSNTISRSNNTDKKEISYPNEKEISITSSLGNKIYGTLLSKNKDQKLAIIIAGSGPTDREGNNPLGVDSYSYQMLAHALDSQNIATFRYDKTGIGKSRNMDLKESDFVFENGIKDAENIFDFLHDSLGFKNIYFIGHSEGSLVGMIASQKRKAKGFVSIAGAGRPIDVVLQEQMANANDSIKTDMKYIISQLKKGKEVNEKLIPPPLMQLFRKSIQPYIISWMKYSPEKEIKKLTCPVLILQGTCDIQVKENDAKNLHEANKKSTLDIIPLMTHTLKNAGKDCVNQQKTYSDATMPLNQLLVKDIANFIKNKS